MASERVISSKYVYELEQRGVPLTGDLEEILNRDPESDAYKTLQNIIREDVEKNIFIEELAYLFQEEKRKEEALFELEKSERMLEEERSKKNREDQEEFDKKQHQLTPSKIATVTPDLIEKINAFVELSKSVHHIQIAIDQLRANKQVINNAWQQQQLEQAQHFIQHINNIPITNNTSIVFDPNSAEAIELQNRLAAIPTIPEMLNKLDNTPLHDIYESQVTLQQDRLRQMPAFSNNNENLELAAREQAILDLKLDLRQLQNKFINAIPALINYMKAKLGQTYLDRMVNEYNNDLGQVSEHKRTGIFKILERAISPYLMPTLTMENRQRKQKHPDELDFNDIQTQALKANVQEKHLQNEKHAQMNMLKSLLPAIQEVAAKPGYDFLSNIIDMLKPQQQHTNKLPKLLPRNWKRGQEAG